MKSESESNILVFTGIAMILLLVISATFTITQAVNTPHDYARGYCTALGGTVLNNETCDVDGKVIVITKEG